mgnify:CR=1 FL=1
MEFYQGTNYGYDQIDSSNNFELNFIFSENEKYNKDPVKNMKEFQNRENDYYQALQIE